MKMKDLVSKVALTEGKKNQASVGDVREILGIVSDIIFAEPESYDVLYTNGKKRAKKNSKVASACEVTAEE